MQYFKFRNGVFDSDQARFDIKTPFKFVRFMKFFKLKLLCEKTLDLIKVMAFYLHQARSKMDNCYKLCRTYHKDITPENPQKAGMAQGMFKRYNLQAHCGRFTLRIFQEAKQFLKKIFENIQAIPCKILAI